MMDPDVMVKIVVVGIPMGDVAIVGSSEVSKEGDSDIEVAVVGREVGLLVLLMDGGLEGESDRVLEGSCDKASVGLEEEVLEGFEVNEVEGADERREFLL